MSGTKLSYPYSYNRRATLIKNNQKNDVAEQFFQDLQAEFRNWEVGISSQEKPKSLWEELAVSLSLTIVVITRLFQNIVYPISFHFSLHKHIVFCLANSRELCDIIS